VIVAEGSGIFSEENRLAIAPKLTDTVNLKLIKTSSGGAYDASAYVVASGAGDNVNLHDTNIDTGGLLDLIVTEGNADLNGLGIYEGGEMVLAVGSGNITMNDTIVGGTMDMSTGSGNITMNEVDISGSMDADTLAGDVSMNDVDVRSAGRLEMTSGEGDVTIDQVTSDGTLQITTGEGNLLMKDEDSLLTMGEHSTLTEGDTWVDIGGDIGSADNNFAVDILLDENAEAQPFNIKNAANIYLVQETGIVTDDDTLPNSGRDENGNTGEHDEAVSGMEEEDETVHVTMPAQTPEEIAAQLSNGSFTEEQLLALISGILTGEEIKALLGIDDTALDALAASLESMDAAELAALVSSLELGVAEPETKLDLTVLNRNNPQEISALAAQLGLSSDADKGTVLSALRTKLGLPDSASVSQIKYAYNNYYQYFESVSGGSHGQFPGQHRKPAKCRQRADRFRNHISAGFGFKPGRSRDHHFAGGGSCCPAAGSNRGRW
jgi:hypothetical protein